MRMPRTIPLAALLVLAGCARFSFQQPTAQLVAVQVTGVGLEGGALRLQLDVHNPNAYRLTTTRIAVSIDLDGTHFGDVELAQAIALPAQTTTPVEIPLAFTWSGVGAGARALLGRGAVRYGLTGRLEVDTPVGPRRVEVRGAGDVSLRDIVGGGGAGL
ncbi:MAG: LEA type 2 family protein [Gemmatimonadota bacterium]|nr:LEA type 2 family protein [Gemmatimonadota bacterium]